MLKTPNARELDLEGGKDRLFVVALARGFDVLRCFTPQTPELGTSEIARMTGIPQPTVWRLCYTLLQLGYLVSMPGRETMRPGIALLGLGQAVLAAHPISEIALPHMMTIAERYEGAVSLGARDANDIVFLQRCSGASIVLAGLRQGSRVPLLNSPAGWAYIAGLSPKAREELFNELQKTQPEIWASRSQDLLAALNNYDETGYVITHGIMHKRINGAAVPLISDDGQVVLGLSSGGIAEMFDDQTLIRVACDLRTLAKKLSPMLNFSVRHQS